MKAVGDKARYLAPPLSEGRADRVWAGIAARRAPRASRAHTKPRARFALVALAACLPAIVAFFVGSRWRRLPEQVAAGVTIGSEAESRTLRMPYGSEIELSPRARVTLVRAEASEERIVLEHGAASFRVVHNPSHRFVVVVGAVQVVDIGTVFRVEREEGGGTVRVSVTSGDVEVRSDDGPPRPLHAGESLITSEDAGRAGSFAQPGGPSESSGAGVEPPASAVSASVAPRETPSVEGSSSATRAVPPDVTPSARHPTTAPVSPADSAGPTAKSLLAEGMAARQAGNARAAAQAFDTLRTRFPRDPRAPLAALELGRIRMDQLGDPRGALEALQGVAGEDAEARVVILLDRLGEVGRCHTAKDAFISRYPASIHLSSIRARCP
jgi:hypothetical protein